MSIEIPTTHRPQYLRAAAIEARHSHPLIEQRERESNLNHY